VQQVVASSRITSKMAQELRQAVDLFKLTVEGAKSGNSGNNVTYRLAETQAAA
jgi:hypothetical protein